MMYVMGCDLPSGVRARATGVRTQRLRVVAVDAQVGVVADGGNTRRTAAGSSHHRCSGCGADVRRDAGVGARVLLFSSIFAALVLKYLLPCATQRFFVAAEEGSHTRPAARSQELLYHETDIPALMATVDRHLARGGVVILTFHVRVWGLVADL
eukprot:COSAG01_NODE_40565_length_462_cov_0.741047_1_plen_153_part_11